MSEQMTLERYTSVEMNAHMDHLLVDNVWQPKMCKRVQQKHNIKKARHTLHECVEAIQQSKKTNCTNTIEKSQPRQDKMSQHSIANKSRAKKYKSLRSYSALMISRSRS